MASPVTTRRRPARTVGQGPFERYVVPVVRVVRLTPRSVRVTFRAPELAGFPASAPDQWVKLFFPLPHQQRPPVPTGPEWYRDYLAMAPNDKPAMRTYTVRRHDRATCELDVDLVLHGDSGPGSAWAERVRPGQLVGVFGPGAAYEPTPGAAWRLLVGDETAVPAIGAILEAELDPAVAVHAFVEVADAAEQLDLVRGAHQHVTWVRRSARAGGGPTLLDAVRASRLPGEPGYAWLAGEAGLVRDVRRHLVGERGHDRADITFLGYWRCGRAEDDPRDG